MTFSSNAFHCGNVHVYTFSLFLVVLKLFLLFQECASLITGHFNERQHSASGGWRVNEYVSECMCLMYWTGQKGEFNICCAGVFPGRVEMGNMCMSDVNEVKESKATMKAGRRVVQ